MNKNCFNSYLLLKPIFGCLKVQFEIGGSFLQSRLYRQTIFCGCSVEGPAKKSANQVKTTLVRCYQINLRTKGLRKQLYILSTLSAYDVTCKKLAKTTFKSTRFAKGDTTCGKNLTYAAQYKWIRLVTSTNLGHVSDNGLYLVFETQHGFLKQTPFICF